MPAADDIVLGVELEFAVINDPNSSETYESQWPVVKSYPKNQVWTDCVHKGHGSLVRVIEEVTGGFIRVGYDATVAPEPDGFECYSQPGPFMDQLQAWSAFWDSSITNHLSVAVAGTTPGGLPKMCGMHVHVSGKLMTPITMANMLMFINNRGNADFVRHVADRYDGHYSKVHDGMTFENALCLYHADDCAEKSRRKKKILESTLSQCVKFTNDPTGWADKQEWCCQNAAKFHDLKMKGYWVRGALWVLPKEGTGDCEFRLFATPTSKKRFLANLEFVHSLVEYCHLTAPRGTGYREFCEWLMEVPTRRIRYTNLFKWLREAGYVEGLIPRRKKLGGKSVKATIG